MSLQLPTVHDELHQLMLTHYEMFPLVILYQPCAPMEEPLNGSQGSFYDIFPKTFSSKLLLPLRNKDYISLRCSFCKNQQLLRTQSGSKKEDLLREGSRWKERPVSYYEE